MWSIERPAPNGTKSLNARSGQVVKCHSSPSPIGRRWRAARRMRVDGIIAYGDAECDYHTSPWTRRGYSEREKAESFVAPGGLALFYERGRSFDAIFAGERHPERFLLEAQAGVFFHRERCAQSGFRLAQRERGFAGQFFRQRARRLHQLLGRDDLVCQAQRECGFRVDHVAGHYQLARLRLADTMRQALRTTETRHK